MNCQMQSITVTARDGRVTNVEQIFIRGSMIRFFILPDMLKNAPMFKAKTGVRGGGAKPMMRPPGRLWCPVFDCFYERGIVFASM